MTNNFSKSKQAPIDYDTDYTFDREYIESINTEREVKKFMSLAEILWVEQL